VAFLHTSSRAVANSEEFVRILRTARAVFFTGGRSKVLDQTYHGTVVERELKALLERGGVLAGDSAGAITLGCFWLSWPTPTSALGKVTDGLCMLPQVTVTPHVRPAAARIAEEEVTQENTVLVLNGGTAEVLGRGSVSIFGDLADPQAAIHLKAGTTLNLRTPG
jgi:cyanophycinase